MGSLYLGWDPMLERQIAIKLLRDDNEELRERFAREARSVARLRHPNIVTIFDVGEQDGQPFIAMEYIQGQTLGDLIRRGAPLALTRKLQIIDDISDGLAFAHKAGIVHRDVKPANVMVEHEGDVKILDFGIARIAESGMTQAGMLIGTLNYMSPEQVAGRIVDRRSDIFAVGAVMYELLALKQAFPGGLHNGILNRILHEPPPPLASICADLDPEVIEIVDRALEKQPEARFQDLQAMRRELQRVRQRLEQNPGDTVALSVDAETMAVLPSVPTPARQTPRRGTDREGLARRRASHIAAHIEAANQAMSAGDYEAAVAAAEQALLLHPDEPDAIEILERARGALDEIQARELVRRGEELLRNGSLTEALTIANQAITLAPSVTAARELREHIERERLQREQERIRHEAIRAAMTRAQTLLDKGAFEGAAAAAAEALALDSDLADAKEIQARAHEAVDRARQEALDRRAAEAVAAAEQLFDKNPQGAVAQLTAFEPQHPVVVRALAAFRDTIARREREAKEAEELRAAVAARIADAQKATSHEAAIELLEAALKIDPANEDARRVLRERQKALDAAREQARRERERDEKIAGAIARAQQTSNHEQGIAILKEALALDKDRNDVRDLIVARDKALAQEREEAKRVRERNDRIAALLTKAKQTQAHDAAIAILKEALALDSARADVRDALSSREAALEQAREEARRSKEKAEQVEAALATARATASHQAAVAILQGALGLDPQHQELRVALQTRQAALDAHLEQVRKARERDEKIAAAIARARAARSHSDAIAILTDAQTLDPKNVEVGKLLAERQAAQAEEERQARERAEKIRDALARANSTESHAAALDILTQALAFDPRHPEVQRAREQRAAALAHEREQARLARERNEQIAGFLARAAAAAGHEAAMGFIHKALALDAEHVEARKALDERQHALARQQEAEREIRERDEKIAAAVTRAKSTASHADAIQMLTNALALDPTNATVKSQLETRGAAMKREAAEAKRQQEIEAGRQQAADLIAKGDFDGAENALRSLEALNTGKSIKELRRQLKDARTRSRRAEPASAKASTGEPVASGAGMPRWAIGVAAAVVIVALGAFLLKSNMPPQPAGPAATTATTKASPAPNAAEPVKTAPATQPAAQPDPDASANTTTGSEAPPPRSNPPANGTVDRDRIAAAAIATGRQQVQRNEWALALATTVNGLRVDPANDELKKLQRDIARAAIQQAAAAAKSAGSVVQGVPPSSPAAATMKAAQAKQAQGTRLERSGQNERIARTFWEARDLFAQAEREAREATAAAAAAARPTVAPPMETKSAAVPAPTPPEPARETPPPPAAQPRQSPANPAPPVNPPAAPPSTAQAAPVSNAAAIDEAAIRSTLSAYAQAMSTLDVDAVRRVFPAIPRDALTRTFSSFKALEVRIANEKISFNGASATVQCDVTQSFTPKVGSGRTETRAATFTLQKTGARGWIIQSRQ